MPQALPAFGTLQGRAALGNPALLSVPFTDRIPPGPQPNPIPSASAPRLSLPKPINPAPLPIPTHGHSRLPAAPSERSVPHHPPPHRSAAQTQPPHRPFHPRAAGSELPRPLTHSLTMVQMEAILETVIRISIRPAPSSAQSQRRAERSRAVPGGSRRRREGKAKAE